MHSVPHHSKRTQVSLAALLALVALAVSFAGRGSAHAAGAARVVIIGIDGMKGEAAVNAKTPNIHRLMRDGAYTLKARAIIPFVSKPNWGAMIMGAAPELTGVTSNDWMPTKFEIAPICKDAAGIFPTIFGLLRDQEPSAVIGVFTDWDGFATLVEPKAPDVIDVTDEDQAKTTQQVIAFIQQRKPTLIFIHYDSVDEAGHTFGWDTPQYYAAVSRVDGYIGEIMGALNDAGVLHQTVLLVTADHGGRGLDHGENNMANVEIPWIISGPDIKRGFEISAPVVTYDTAATVAYIFGLTAPSCWRGRPVLAAFTAPPK
jgi:predicted AlkP superfamily pyrophosphatase or phosphodiesterase